jgi:hypothetical protein
MRENCESDDFWRVGSCRFAGGMAVKILDTPDVVKCLDRKVPTMGFVSFEDSVGSGLVLPDGLGGTKLCYLRRKGVKTGIDSVDRICDDSDVLVERDVGLRRIRVRADRPDVE